MDRFDGLLIIGIGLMAAGLGAIYWPLALITLGAGLIAFAFLGARASTTPAPKQDKTP